MEHSQILGNQSISRLQQRHSQSRGILWQHSYFLAPRWSKMIEEISSIFNNHVQFMVLGKFLGGNIGFINVHGPNELMDWTQL